MSGYSIFNRTDRRRGLTLVEMLTVLFVVSILVAFITGISRHATHAAETRRAQADLHLLADALDRYFLRFGDYPLDPSTTAYQATELLDHTQRLPGQANNNYAFRHLLPRTFTAIDPWGSSYIYLLQSTETDAPPIFTLYSLGPDKEKPDDDIML